MGGRVGRCCGEQEGIGLGYVCKMRKDRFIKIDELKKNNLSEGTQLSQECREWLPKDGLACREHVGAGGASFIPFPEDREWKMLVILFSKICFELFL